VFALSIVVAAVFAGSLVYCVLIVLAARSYRLSCGRGSANADDTKPSRDRKEALPLSVLKPLSGIDEGLEQNLRSFFNQDHPNFEILFAVRSADDPAVAIVEALRKQFPARPSRLIVTGEPLYPNAKVFSLDRMLAEARHDLLVMSDSDIRIPPGFLQSIADEFGDPHVALATCPYQAVAGQSFWSILEAQGMNTEFLAGLLVARMLEGVKFAVGPTVAARKSALQAIGGLPVLKDYLAEDFVMGKFAAEAGFGVILSRNIVEHRIGSQGWRANASHRIRWVRSTRRSRPLGYVGQLFTYPLPLALLLCGLEPAWWPALIAAFAFRVAAAWSTSVWILRARPHWLLLPVEEILSFLFWLAGFFGNTIVWRGRRYYLFPDGRFEPR
jgi:ceramide glucosyltransferase